MKRLAVCLMVWCACSAEDPSIGSQAFHQFFQNSRRRAPTDAEKAPIVEFRIDAGICTAFFVANDQNKHYVLSARHCAGYNLTSWCEKGGVVAASDGSLGKCKRLIAADVDHDNAIFEVTMPPRFRPPGTLRLAGFYPQNDTRLMMRGYPVDKHRRAALTVTENCWYIGRAPAPAADARKNDVQGTHNCTTYGGNSGGPMVIEGTDVAVAVPSSYYPENYEQYEPLAGVNLATLGLIADLVATHRKTLEDAGITLVDEQPAGAHGRYATTGRYRSAAIAGCDMWMIPLFDSGETLTAVKVSFRGVGAGGCAADDFRASCDARGICAEQTRRVEFSWTGSQAFRYRNLSTEGTADYQLE